MEKSGVRVPSFLCMAIMVAVCRVGRFGAIAVASVVVLVTLPSPAIASTVIYNQGSLPPLTGYPSTWDTGGTVGFEQTYDDFSLVSDAWVTDVHWWGLYGPQPNTIESFTVAFFADDTGEPGTLLYSTTIPGNAGETYSGFDSDPSYFGPYPVYAYAVDLPVPFHATAGDTFWLSIFANLDVIPGPSWTWAVNGTGSLVYDFSGERSTDFGTTLFQLTGTPVPEPSALLLLGAGLGAIAVRRRLKTRS